MEKLNNMDKEKLKEVNRVLKESIELGMGFAVFTRGITILYGDKDFCITSVAWSLACIKENKPEIYEGIMKELKDVEKYKKELK